MDAVVPSAEAFANLPDGHGWHPSPSFPTPTTGQSLHDLPAERFALTTDARTVRNFGLGLISAGSTPIEERKAHFSAFSRSKRFIHSFTPLKTQPGRKFRRNTIYLGTISTTLLTNRTFYRHSLKFHSFIHKAKEVRSLKNI